MAKAINVPQIMLGIEGMVKNIILEEQKWLTYDELQWLSYLRGGK